MAITQLRTIIIILAGIMGLCVNGPCSNVLAQTTQPLSPIDQRGVNQPRLSPYLNLLRQDNSALSPYHTFVRPQREVYQQQSRQNLELRRLSNSLSVARRSEDSSTGRLSTGNGAGFQNYMHFYQVGTPSR
jgi:hypothetical protein